ncbi:hypothetical protein BH10ACT3_BH10ACT3_07110 [soil metagenome]
MITEADPTEFAAERVLVGGVDILAPVPEC